MTRWTRAALDFEYECRRASDGALLATGATKHAFTNSEGRGVPLAEVVAFRGPEGKPLPGKLSEALVFEKDIVSPIGEEVWNACK
jgi:hypothetical protein